MEDLVEKINERFLEVILNVQEVNILGGLTSAYLDFAHAVQIMQDVRWQDKDEDVQE